MKKALFAAFVVAILFSACSKAAAPAADGKSAPAPEKQTTAEKSVKK